MPVLIIILALGLFNQAVSAEEGVQDQWYFYVGTGFSPYPQHDSNLQQKIGEAHADGLWSISGGLLELPGAYYRLDDQKLFGFLASALLEEFGRDQRDQRRLAIRSYSGLFTYMNFLKPTIGSGYYYHFDLGVESLQIVTQTSLIPNSSTNDTGVMVRGGFGYGFDFFGVAHTLIEVGPYYSTAGPNTLWGALVRLGVLL